MPTQHLETDYLILGAGAMSMGFADVILDEDPAARIVMVDRHANPGRPLERRLPVRAAAPARRVLRPAHDGARDRAART